MANGIVRAGQPVSVPTPTAADHAARKDYVDAITPLSIGAQTRLTPTATKTANYTAVVGELVMVDSTSGNITITLPAAASGAVVGVKKLVAANVVTITRAGSDTIGHTGATSGSVVAAEQVLVLQANGTNWVTRESSLFLGTLDSRYAAISHTHSAADITSGILDTARIPAVLSPRFTITYAATVTPDCNNGPYQVCTATGAVALAIPTNATEDYRLTLRFIASAAQRVVTFNASYKRPSHIASTLTIPSGLRGDIGLLYEAAYGWTVLAAQVA